MEKASSAGSHEGESQPCPKPTGAVDLTEERLRELAPHWETLSRGLRQMDELDLGDTEPVSFFVWRLET